MPEPNASAKLQQASPEVTLEQPTTREITQTDHINKKLLTSLFNRMDEESETPQDDMMHNETNEDEWKD